MSKVELFKKIQAVSNDIRSIEKDMVVGSGQYSYKAVSDYQVTIAVKEAETKHGLLSIPTKQELINSEIVKTVKKNGDEGNTYVDTIKMTVQIIDLDTGEFVDIETFGKGIDSGDKGFGKASTYARKYALLNAYKIATGEDPDADKSVEQLSPKTMDEREKIVLNYLNDNTDKLVKLCEHFSVQDVGDLTKEQINTIYLSYKQKGVL